MREGINGFWVAGLLLVGLAAIGGVFLWRSLQHGSEPKQMLLIPQTPINLNSDLPDDNEAALATIVGRATFDIELPSYFPTSADRLAWVNDGPHKYGATPQPSNRLDAVYESDETMEVDGQTIHSYVEVQLFHDTIVTASARQVPVDTEKYTLFKQVIYKDAAGEPRSVLYVVRFAPFDGGREMTLTFTGEQPTLDGLQRMIASFVPVAIPAS